MAQPFSIPGTYASKLWPGLVATRHQDHVLIQSPTILHTLSNALIGGGFSHASRFVNWKVPLAYDDPDPVAAMRNVLQSWHYPQEKTIGLMTAAALTRCAVEEEEGDGFRLFCCTTAGVSNAVRAGQARHTFPAFAPGTINTILLIHGRMTPAAMVNALLTATEAKAAALQELDIRDPGTGDLATGTSTDALVVGASQAENAPLHRYAGTATALGHTLSRLVSASIHAALQPTEPLGPALI